MLDTKQSLNSSESFFSKLKRKSVSGILKRSFSSSTQQIKPHYTYCSNCNEELHGMYCSKCGQYAHDINQGIGSYIRQFLENTYQFDGKLILSFRHLLLNPGYLTTEFMKGKIRSYVFPMKLYMFMSIIFFSFILLFFTSNETDYDGLNLVSIVDKESQDIDKIDKSNSGIIVIVKDKNKDEEIANVNDNKTFFNLFTGIEKLESINSIDKKQNNLINQRIMGFITQYIPLIFLLLIPLYGAFLKISYRKNSYVYMHNIVMAFHLHTFFLIGLSLYMIITSTINIKSDSFLTYLFLSIFFIYHIIAAKRVYKRSWILTTLKTLTNLFIYSIILLVTLIFIFFLIANKIGNEYGSGLI